jgi:hypothetical protein
LRLIRRLRRMLCLCCLTFCLLLLRATLPPDRGGNGNRTDDSVRSRRRPMALSGRG